MVTVSLRPKKGNHTRFFPHSGHLGLSPVVVSGSVVTQLGEDRALLPASRVVVRLRCYEAAGASQSIGVRPDRLKPVPAHDQHLLTNPARSSNVNLLWQTETTVWDALKSEDRSSDGYTDLGDSVFNWKLTIPPEAVDTLEGGNAVGSVTYKTWRAWWLVEAVLYHKPLGMCGSKIVKTHPLFLPNYSRGRWPADTRTELQSSNSRLSYFIRAPVAMACGDRAHLTFSITGLSSSSSDEKSQDHMRQQARMEEDSGFTIKRVSVSLVRTLSVETGGMANDPPEPKRWKLRKLTTNTSQPLLVPSRPYPSRHASSVTTTIVEADGLNSHCVPLQADTTFSSSIAVTVPSPKSRYHYSIGESCKTRLASIQYSFVFKVVVKTKTRGVETINLNPIEVKIWSVSKPELAKAIDQIELRKQKLLKHKQFIHQHPCGDSTLIGDYDDILSD